MQVALMGVTGYSGMVLYNLLKQHPAIDQINLYGHADAQPVALKTVAPMYQKETAIIRPFDADVVMQENAMMFFATSAGVSQQLALPLIAADFPVIDLSGDFRLQDPEQYQRWYHRTSAPITALEKASYGLADLPAPLTAYVANPGCYATATLLGLAPLVQQHLIDPTTIVVDAKSGLSGAGKGLTSSSHYVNVNDNLSLYKVNQHQHIPEIVQQLQRWWSAVPAIEFTTTLIPVTRGIMSTIYACAAQPLTTAQLVAAFEQTYQEQPFVQVLPSGTMPDLKMVIGTNNCALGVNYNPVTKTILVVSVIDNLMKGAAGQAIQNFNRYFQLAITTGLPTLPVFP
ncbi:N-acetyl-gamma-glutamyl-phosphate reductase [Lactiplantibacillus herbarum]|uniref:N-acetyl-gamma-glutamyl-phosphate reductase n=1 Tax=Lactiplantibacillus herbarum TaxID=1670446 RepID=UPI00064E7713|nr:N-acetyl-gamma-glutamyl-phosphate reductase [Lactiplantibacillus herbarum]